MGLRSKDKSKKNHSPLGNGLASLGSDMALGLDAVINSSSSSGGKGKKGKKGKGVKNAKVQQTQVYSKKAGGKKGKGKKEKKVLKKVTKKTAKTSALKDQIAIENGQFEYEVQISNPLNLSAEEMLQQLQQALPQFQLNPHQGRKAKSTVYLKFLPTHEHIVQAIAALNKQFTVNGKTVAVSVSQKVTAKQQSIIPLEVISPRYDPVEKVFNFYQASLDPAIQQYIGTNGFNDAAIVAGVVEIIHKNCRNVVAIDLGGNNIQTLSAWARLGTAAPNIKKISLADNAINSLSQLVHLRSFKNLEEIVLVNNPCVATFKSRGAYEKQVTKSLKNLKKLCVLDGVVIDIKLQNAPVAKNLGLLLTETTGDPAIIERCRGFMESYLMTYQSDNRDELAGFYTPKAEFNLVIQSIGKGKDSLKVYVPPRNKQKTFRTKRTGPIDIVGLIKKFPNEVNHLGDTMNYNIVEAGQLEDGSFAINFVVSGVYQELIKKADTPLERMFKREIVLVLQSEDGPMMIKSETLHIAKYSQQVKEAEQARNTHEQQLGQQPQQQQQQQQQQNPGEQQQKEMMLQQFMNDTNMISEFAVECLENNNWDYDSSLQHFSSLHKDGQIPQHAFLS